MKEDDAGEAMGATASLLVSPPSPRACSHVRAHAIPVLTTRLQRYLAHPHTTPLKVQALCVQVSSVFARSSSAKADHAGASMSLQIARQGWRVQDLEFKV